MWHCSLIVSRFYFLFTIVMKVLISCTENPKIFIEVLDELEHFIDKKKILDEKIISVGPPSVSKFCNPHNVFFLLTLILLLFRLRFSETILKLPGPILSGAPIRIFGSFTLLRYETLFFLGKFSF
jgi:hypothetical protein